MKLGRLSELVTVTSRSDGTTSWYWPPKPAIRNARRPCSLGSHVMNPYGACSGHPPSDRGRVAASIHGLVMDLGAVFHFCADSERVPDAMLTRTLLQGFMESTRPVTFGGGLLVIALVLMAIGSSRLARKENPAA